MEESLGNQNLLRILPAFLTVVKSGGMLLIDEFSSGFHNELENLLVRYFMEKSGHAQMLFVSHSTNLLSNSILRPDQEYSVEFQNKTGVLSDGFHPSSHVLHRTSRKCMSAAFLAGFLNTKR